MSVNEQKNQVDLHLRILWKSTMVPNKETHPIVIACMSPKHIIKW